MRRKQDDYVTRLTFLFPKHYPRGITSPNLKGMKSQGDSEKKKADVMFTRGERNEFHWKDSVEKFCRGYDFVDGIFYDFFANFHFTSFALKYEL